MLRGLLRRFEGDDRPQASRPATPPQPVAKQVSVRPGATPSGKQVPPPKPSKSSKSPVPPAIQGSRSGADKSPASGNQGDDSEIELPLAAVIAALPTELRARVTSVPPAGQTIRLSSETVVSQLAYGSVKITFGELRQLAPGIFSNSGGEHDIRPVNLPLNELLKRVNPALLSRRTTQKVRVSEDIAGPFSERGRGFSFTTQPLKASAAQPVQPAAEPEREPAKPIAFTPPPRQATTAPAPAKPTLPPVVARPTPPPAAPSKPTLPPTVRVTGASAPKPVQGTNGNHSPAPPPAPAPVALKLSAAPPPEPVAAAPTAPPEPAQPTIFAKLSDLSGKWPDNLKDEIQTSAFASATVALAGSVIEPGLKRGRVAVTWKQIRLLIAPGSPASSNDALELELPLHVIAPMFMTAQKHANSARSQTKAPVSASIPDLFFGFPQPAAAEPVAPPPPPPIPLAMATPLPAASTAPMPVGKPPSPSETNFYPRSEANATPGTTTFRPPETPSTDFATRQLQPSEVVARAIALPGMAGVVLALQDGLKVASQVPPDQNADALAGFLPQIFDRVNSSTRELRMGPLNNVNFTVGNVPWKIFRVNAIYFAAFGQPGASLPSAQLAQLAADLDRKKI